MKYGRFWMEIGWVQFSKNTGVFGVNIFFSHYAQIYLPTSILNRVSQTNNMFLSLKRYLWWTNAIVYNKVHKEIAK